MLPLEPHEECMKLVLAVACRKKNRKTTIGAATNKQIMDRWTTNTDDKSAEVEHAYFAILPVRVYIPLYLKGEYIRP